MRAFLVWLLLLSAVGAQTAEITERPFDKFLKYNKFEVRRAGRIFRGGFVHGPGHHSAAVAALTFNSRGEPYVVIKRGDTRLSRAERGEPYVLDGFIAGRLDKKGAGAVKIALAELAEEVGAEVVPGTFRALGDALTPTMPLESTECDSYFQAVVEITGVPSGDGGSMEVVDLIGPKFLTPEQLLGATRAARISDSSRAESLFCRSFDSMGFLPRLGVFVQDHPRLLARYRTLGLGRVLDLRRTGAEPGEVPPSGSKINDVVVVDCRVVELDRRTRMIDAKTRHAVGSTARVEPQGPPFSNQYLQLDYDRAKVVHYYEDPQRGPLVEMTLQPRPCLAFAPGSPKIDRLDVEDRECSRAAEPPQGLQALGEPCGASSGQSDLYYHFWARKVERPGTNFILLSDALTLCRQGDGDVQTETALLRLADYLGWIPNLEMSVERARVLLGKNS